MPRFKYWLLVFLAALAKAIGASSSTGASPAISPALIALEARAPDETTDPFLVLQFKKDVDRLIENNALTTGEEFFRAANLSLVGIDEFRDDQVRYELLLAAEASGYAAAEKQLPDAWDWILVSLGRPSRFGTLRPDPKNADMRPVDVAPMCIISVMIDPAKARAVAKSAHDNVEMKEIVDADQAIRMGKDWSKFTRADFDALEIADHRRNVRAREIVTAGQLHSVQDFVNASLVMQHSPNFVGYELAHELAVCSLLLGDRSDGRWLVAATYDRMLESIGQDQRFGTQYGQAGLRPVSESGICDAERIALGCRHLQASIGNGFVDHAQLLNQQGKYADAESFARKGLTLRQSGYPAGNWNIFAAQAALGNSLRGQKRFAEAAPLLLAAYAGLNETAATIPPEYQVRIREAMDALARLYEATSQSDKAKEWRHLVEEYDRTHPGE